MDWAFSQTLMLPEGKSGREVYQRFFNLHKDIVSRAHVAADLLPARRSLFHLSLSRWLEARCLRPQKYGIDSLVVDQILGKKGEEVGVGRMD